MAYSPFRHIGSLFWKGRPIQLTFFLTRRCNSRCRFCFYLSDKSKPEDLQDELSLEETKKISSSLGSLLWLAFSGGEIFLRDDIVEITKAFYRNNRPAIILFPTNGLMTGVIKERMHAVLKQCPESTVVVKLSLDGPEEVHDKIRGVRGSYRKTLQTYEALSALLDLHRNFELGINTVFCPENQDYMQEIIESVRAMDRVRTHTVSLVRGKSLKEIDMEKYRETIEALAENLRRKMSGTYRFSGAGLKAAQDILQRRLIYETETRKKQMVDCYAGRLNLVLTETGGLYPCESFTRKMGDLREKDYDVRKVLQTHRAREVLRSIRKSGCFCSHECYLMTNILFNVRMYPELLREYFRTAGS